MPNVTPEVITLGFSSWYKNFILRHKKKFLGLFLFLTVAVIAKLIEDINHPSHFEVGDALSAALLAAGLPLAYSVLFRGGAGRLTLDDQGIEFNTTMVGRITWPNLASYGRVKILKADFLGFAVKDLDEYFALRKDLVDRHQPIRSVAEAMIKGNEKKLQSLNPVLKYNHIILPIVTSMAGATPKPASLDEKGHCEWLMTNYGCHFWIPEFIVPDIDDVVARISAHKHAVASSGAAPISAPNIRPGGKKVESEVAHLTGNKNSSP